jgi:subtilase family serine protease
LTVAAGSYYLGACADDTSAIGESNETDNCRVSATTIQVTFHPNLVISSLNNPPASVAVLATFSVTDTTINSGNMLAAASTIYYRLSTDTAITSADPLLTGTRPVPALAAGGNSTGTVTVRIPLIVAPGAYYLGACADATNVVAESSETDNCRVSTTTIQATVHPDLRISSLSDPPALAPVGGRFSVSDTTLNQGIGPAGASTTAYRLSTDATITSTDPLLTGSRSVPSLAAGVSFIGFSSMVTIPSNLALGTYYLGACADDTNVVVEPDGEMNNCRASATTIELVMPGNDLVVSTVTEPPSTAAVRDSFSVTDTVVNLGNLIAGASTTHYYLSLDDRKDRNDFLLTGERSVPLLGVLGGASSSGMVTVTIPSTVIPGLSYFFLACADDTNQVAEFNENNNCVRSRTTIEVR